MILERFPIILRPPTVIRKTLLHTEKEFLDFVNENNGKRDIFVNLYHYTRTSCCSSFYYFDRKKQKFICNSCRKEIQYLDLSSFIIDCVVFDLDPIPPSRGKKILQWIKAKWLVAHFKEYETYLMKSGKGFHFYIRTKPTVDKDYKYGAKNAIRNFQIETEKIFGKTDWITHGDTSQMIRVPGTWNIRSNAFCFCIEKNHLKLRYRNLEKIGEWQPPIKIYPINRGKRIDLKKYDTEPDIDNYIYEGELITNINEDENKINNFKKIFNIYHIKYEKLSPCVKIMLNNKFLDYRQRFLLINIIKNLGISEKDCEKIIKLVLWSTPDPTNKNPNKRWNWASHCINRERQVYYIYHKHYGIPSCKSGFKLGFKLLKICDNCKTKNIMNFR